MDSPGQFNPRTPRSKVSAEEMARLSQSMNEPAVEVERLEHTGGARAGWMNYSFPFAKLEADKTGLSLRAGFMTYRLKAEEVVSLSMHKGWFDRGVKIEHRLSTAPENLIFWPMSDVDQLLEDFVRLGYTVR